MREATRPDPDTLLAALRSRDRKPRQGRLKIFLGMCPGVGKTFAMLEAARARLAEGVEVVAGIVETHGRPETEALLAQVPVVPRIEIEHRGVKLTEMDLDAIVVWQPDLVLVDELPHTNAPGSRHPKRYQDVLELLAGGIDVYTTLNVQHVESRGEAVRELTGVAVRESVPDSVLDRAEEIELVDLTPEQLRKRLEEGKVYRGSAAATARDHFFREENLIALREMALRLTAEQVDRRRQDLRSARPGEPRAAGDRLMVAVGPSPHSAELVRWTRRYAAAMGAPWIAVAVETARPLSAGDEKRRSEHLSLARRLGAEVVLASGGHIGEALLRVASERGVTQIVLGKPDGSPWRWVWPGRSPVPWLVQHSGHIDVQLIRTTAPAAGPGERQPATEPARLRPYAVAFGVGAAATVAGSLLLPWAGYWSVALVYLFTVTLAGVSLRRGPTLLLAAFSALLWNFLFIPPVGTFYIGEPQDAMMFGMFFVVALATGHLTARLRERERLERRREARASALYQLTRQLASATSRDQAVREVLLQLKGAFGLDAAILLRDETGAFSGCAHPASTWPLSAKEEAVAVWAFRNCQPAGGDTDTLPDAEGLHLPLVVAGQAEGVLSLKLPPDNPLPREQRELLDTFAAQLAIVAETRRQTGARQQAQLLAEAQRLQKTLFDSVSHELKTPIAAIAAALDRDELDREEIRDANDRLARTVGHLLDATRIEAGPLKPVPEWCDAEELAREACARAAAEGRITLEIAPGTPLLRVDPGLTVQALASLIENALTHGASAEPPLLRVAPAEDRVCFEVADRGRGLPPGPADQVFGKFYRAHDAPPGGLGLGLSIARRLVEAQGGTLTAADRAGGGTTFRLVLPAGGKPALPA